MTKIASKLDAHSADFKANASAMAAFCDALKQKRAEAALGGNEKSRARHTARRGRPASARIFSAATALDGVAVRDS